MRTYDAPMAPMSMPQPSPKTRRRFDALAEELSPKGVVRGSMFGMPCLKLEGKGKAFAGVWGDARGLQAHGRRSCGRDEVQGSRTLDSSGLGRPMKEWVMVPDVHASRWLGLAESSRAYVAD